MTSRKQALAASSVLILAAAMALPALASSHREAPFITTAPKVDGTDFYMFRSYESGRADYVTIVADYLPLQDAYGGPNYFSLDPNALYEIHIDNNGDAKEDLSFQFRFKNTLKNAAVKVGDQQVAIPLVHGIGMTGTGDSSRINVVETYSVDVVRGDRRTGMRGALTDAHGGGASFTKPLDFIGHKTFGSDAGYEAYAARYVYTVNIPGCGQQGRVFVGQRKEPFVVALGPAFDQFNLNPVGPAVGGNDTELADKNITAIALELPIACVTRPGEPVIGGWTTASLRQARLLDAAPASGNNTVERVGGAWTQVSRLGMPLVNELVIGLKDKDRFNASQPKNDGQFATYVTNPTLPAVLQGLFNVPAPTNLPRKDLIAAFLTGVKGLNQPKNVVASEMLRLNTAVVPTPAATQKNLGVLAGDAAGFPNGRRPGDDVVDAELRVAMGVLCTLNQKDVFGCVPGDAGAGGAPLTDGATVDASFFDAVFPYLKTPLPGARN
ncbi:MAG: DUF4331 domain-containing protein [Aquabacterium sp.]|nr:MAG: DUF4331 domain-containing protein [Aquabacterium sp.]